MCVALGEIKSENAHTERQTKKKQLKWFSHVKWMQTKQQTRINHLVCCSYYYHLGLLLPIYWSVERHKSRLPAIKTSVYRR